MSTVGDKAETESVGVDDRVEYVYQRLRAEILSGELAPGHVLSQVQLAARLSTSRTPLREALKRLLAENLVVGDFNRRMRVSELELQDFDQIYALRLAVEPMSVTAAMPTWIDADRERLVQSEHAMEEAVSRLDIGRFRRAHRDFHLGLTRGSGDRIERLLEDLWDNSERYRLTYLHHDYDDPDSKASEQLRTSQAEHRQILVAALAGDAAACTAELFAHIHRSLEIVYEVAAARPQARVASVVLQQLRAHLATT